MLARLFLLLLAPLLAPACAAAGDPSPSVATPADTAPVDSTAPVPTAEFDHAHGGWNELLSRHVRGDAFDYAALKKDPSPLKAYLKQLHAVTPDQLSSWSKEQRFAFWINVYNAHTIEKIVDNYPLKSIKKLSGALGLNSVFDDRFIDMPLFHPKGKQKKLSLNDVENEILRKRFQDARLHAAINCASYSCPPLLGEAFVAAELDGQLERQMRAFLADPKRNRYDTDKGVLRLSKIFEWFEGDFERDAGSVRDYVLRFGPPEQADFIRTAKIRHIDYDWALNDVRARD